MEYNVNDPKNILGISSLMGDDSNFSISDLEKDIINGPNLLKEEEENNTNQFKREMEKISNMYNFPNDLPNDSYKEEQSNENNYNNYISNNEHRSAPNTANITNILSNSVEDNQLKYMTMEQKKQNYVDDVLNDIDDDKDLEFDIDKEKEEDDKNSLLEQIDMLRITLEDDGIDMSNIPVVTKDNTISDIQNVYKILRLKNDRNRYCSFAEELILSGAYGLEYLFDGQKDWLGRKPDLVGWSNSVKIKLRRCRFQTSTLVKEMMSDYNMSAGLQLMIELIPSMFLYSRQKKLSSYDNMADDSKYNEAISNLNEQMN